MILKTFQVVSPYPHLPLPQLYGCWRRSCPYHLLPMKSPISTKNVASIAFCYEMHEMVVNVSDSEFPFYGIATIIVHEFSILPLFIQSSIFFEGSLACWFEIGMPNSQHSPCQFLYVAIVLS